MRYQYWSRLQEPETDLPDITALKRFAVGDLFHSYIQDFFPKAETEVLVETDDIKGYADIILADEVIDVKSINDWAFKYVLAKGFDVDKEKPEHCLQVAIYAKLLEKPKASLLFINTKNLATVQCDVDLIKWIPAANLEISKLNAYWLIKGVPKAEPRCYNGKECSYCSFLTKCNKLEGKT
jgi:predicted RecB family nuclease